MLVQSDLTVHIGLRSMNVTFASKKEGKSLLNAKLFFNKGRPVRTSVTVSSFL